MTANPKKDYKPKHDSLDDKRARAIGFLKERGIWRGEVDCKHQYVNSRGKTVKVAI